MLTWGVWISSGHLWRDQQDNNSMWRRPCPQPLVFGWHCQRLWWWQQTSRILTFEGPGNAAFKYYNRTQTISWNTLCPDVSLSHYSKGTKCRNTAVITYYGVTTKLLLITWHLFLWFTLLPAHCIIETMAQQYTEQRDKKYCHKTQCMRQLWH